MKIAAFIFARGGSKGLPGKNIRMFSGKPLLAWSIEQALSVEGIEKVIVSTDSVEIAKIAKQYNAEVPFLRPSELAQDNSAEWLAWRHALNYLFETTGSLPDVFVAIPVTAPLRLPIDIENCLVEFGKGDADIVITATEAHRSPYFNMVKIDTEGNAVLVNPPISSYCRRQDVPIVHDVTTVCYVASPKFIMTQTGIFSGKVKAVLIPMERAIDIDTLYDFKIAEFLLKLRCGNDHSPNT